MKIKKFLFAAFAVFTFALTAFAQVRTITLDQNYDGAPRNMIVQTDEVGNLTGAMNAPLILPSPTREGYDFRGWFTSRREDRGVRVLSGANGTTFATDTTIFARWTPQTPRTLNDMPSFERQQFEWVREVRNVCEPSIQPNNANHHSIGNLLFHQIFAGNGSFNWAVRWESDDPVSLETRRQIAAMLYDGINEWVRPLMGYEDFPFGEIPVTVVGWAVNNENLILDRQPNEIIWVNSNHESPRSGYETGHMASAPNARSRFINYRAINSASGGHRGYRWPDSIGGLAGRFDMYLWITKNKEGGSRSAEGGDWGFRWGTEALNAAGEHARNGMIHGVMTHELGHGFGMYDWYGNAVGNCATQGISRNPPGYGNNSRTMMHWTYNTGTSQNPGLNDFDQWHIRYYYNWIRDISPSNRWNFTPIAWVEVDEPVVVECDDGYELVDGECVPILVLVCDDGYELDEEGSACVPICDDDDELVDGECVTTSVRFASRRTARQSHFRLDNRGMMRYNLGNVNYANLQIFDTRGRLIRSMRLDGSQSIVNTNLHAASQVLIWRVESGGRILDQGRARVVR